MTRVAYVNGHYVALREAAVHIEDRGFQFADSVYEVCAVVDGGLADEQLHFERLVRSLAAIRITVPVTARILGLIYRETLRRNRVRNGLIYCQVTRGQAHRDHAFPRPEPEPTLVVTAKRVDPAKLERIRTEGVAIITLRDERWANCSIKSTGLLANVLAKQQAKERGAYEAWLFDEKGNITEGTSTNAWIITQDGILTTRHLDNHILGGVTRAVFLQLAAAAGIPFEERAFSVEEAKGAREAFSTASTVGATPVIAIDGKRISDGKPGLITNDLNLLYRLHHKIGA
ncbi:MAG: D-amino-acid transaminase [Parvibaculum sp.]